MIANGASFLTSVDVVVEQPRLMLCVCAHAGIHDAVIVFEGEGKHWILFLLISSVIKTELEE